MYLTLAVCLMMAGAVAANAAGPAAAKIGVVDMQAVATQSEPAQAAKKQMESKYGKERAALEKQGEALKKKVVFLKRLKMCLHNYTTEVKRRTTKCHTQTAN